MWENSRHLLLFCVVCGAVGSYLLSVYVLLFALVACVCIVVNDSKLSGQTVTAIKNFTFPVPCWIKSTITFLMNSYHLSKPLETESGSRRSSPYSPNVSVHRRPSCRTGRFTCLDENTDYANRRNGIGLCSPSPFSNNYSNSYHGFRRHSGFNDSENSSKIEEFSTPQTSPWTRRQNYSGNEFNNVRRVQTVAGPLLATSGLTKRKSNDFGLYVDANSPGLASRIVQYREEGASTGDGVWTHQPQYNSPGQFPMVQLSHSSSSLPVLSPLSSQKASRRSVRVKIAPPDPLGSRLYPLSTKSNASLSSTMQTDQSMKSVLETLKEISRKRIHSQLEDNDDDAAKRQKRCGPPDVLGTQTDDNDGDGENLAKRLREESPRQQELSPPTRPAKRIRNNEILSSLSSSRKLLQGGIKRKTHSLDWSRCSTPVLGKQQKTVNEDILSSPSLGPLGTQRSTSDAQTLLADDGKKASHPSNSGKNIKTPLENERRNVNSLSSGNLSNSVKESQKNSLQTPPVVPKATKISSPVDDTPWQKDSPFVSVSSPDDIIDDVSALEEKREEDRRSRLMAMMTVISGGEPPVKSAVNPGSAGAGTDASSAFSLGGSFTLPPVSNSHLLAEAMKLLFVVAIAWVGACPARRQAHHFEDSPSPQNWERASGPFGNRGGKRFGNKINRGMFPPGGNSYETRWIVPPPNMKGPPYPFPLPLHTAPRPRYSYSPPQPQEDQEWQDTPSFAPKVPPQPPSFPQRPLPRGPPSFPSPPPTTPPLIRPPRPRCTTRPRPPPLQDEEEDAWDTQWPGPAYGQDASYDADDAPGAPDSEQRDEFEPRRPPFLYHQLLVPAGALDENPQKRGDPLSGWGYHRIPQPPRGRLV